jgi:hypothetical protein
MLELRVCILIPVTSGIAFPFKKEEAELDIVMKSLV